VSDPERLVAVWKTLPGTDAAHWPFNAAAVELIRSNTRLFDGVAAVGYNDPSTSEVLGGASADAIRTARVSGDFFDVLGAGPLIGRTLTREDDAAGAEPALVLTHDAWQRRHGGDAGVIGTRLTLDEQRFTIVGVMPPGIFCREASKPG
jgi:putative ABC transport system permease protein